MSPEELRAYLNTPPAAGPRVITAAEVGALVGHLTRICDTNDRRHAFCKYLFGEESTTTLDAGRWLKIREWLAPTPVDPPGGGPRVWTIRAECYAEARAVIAAKHEADRQAKIRSGQLSFLD